MPSLVTERIESVKAGITSAAAFGLAEITLILTHSAVDLRLTTNLSLPQFTTLWSYIQYLSIAGISGFLFGVTYRYVIRGDRNPHLQDGAVLAFGLVRGLAAIEDTQSTPLWGLIILESIICFAFARIALDTALRFKLIKPFK